MTRLAPIAATCSPMRHGEAGLLRFSSWYVVEWLTGHSLEDMVSRSPSRLIVLIIKFIVGPRHVLRWPFRAEVDAAAYVVRTVRFTLAFGFMFWGCPSEVIRD